MTGNATLPPLSPAGRYQTIQIRHRPPRAGRRRRRQPRSLRNAFYLRPEDFPQQFLLAGCHSARFLGSECLSLA